MADSSNVGAMQAQEQLLRDIRDELRTTRQATVGQGITPGRPSPQFIKAQQTIDRMVAGEWATLGWAGAYQSPIKTSLANDMMGAMGLRAAPQTLWQREYESFAGSMLLDRISSFPADLLMPGFGGRSRDLGAQVYQMSGRFGRSGDGRDTSIHSAMNFARDMQIQAAGDMRLSGADYNSIFSESAKAGQFDFGHGIGDVKSQFDELRNAVADLTKTMRVGATEVAQTLGAFRQFGIVDVADQKRAAERMAASSRVAGVSTPEMAAMVRNGIEGGLQAGFSAGSSAAVTENLVMAAREASRTGLISGTVMAAAGGVQGMVSAQQHAIDAFTGSNAGFYTALGAATGGHGGAFDDLMRGVGVTGGTMGGVAASEARRMDFMSSLTGTQRQRLYNRNIEQQMQLIGVDPNGADATDYAFSLVRGQMGDAAGLAYARQNFSGAGRRQRWGNAFREQSEQLRQLEESNYQHHMENETISGRLRQFTGVIGRNIGQAGRSIGRFLGGIGVDIGMDSSFAKSSTALDLVGDSDLSQDALASVLAVDQIETIRKSRGLTLTGSVSSGAAWAGQGLTLALGGLGAWAGGALGAPLGPFGVIGGAVTGGLAGVAGGQFIAGKFFTAGPTKVDGADVSNYLSAFGGSTGSIGQRAVNISAGKEAGALQKLNGTAGFRAMMSNLERGDMSDTDSLEFARNAAAAASQSGVSGLTASDVVGVARALGADVKMQEGYEQGVGSASHYSTSMKKIMTDAESSGAALASADMASGVQAYAAAQTTETKQMAMSKLRELGITGRNMAEIVNGIDRLGVGSPERRQLADDAAAYVKDRGNATFNRRMTALVGVSRNLLQDAKTQGQLGSDEALQRLEGLRDSPKKLMEILLGKTTEADIDTRMRRLLIDQDDTGTLRNVSTIGSMDHLMLAAQNDKLTSLSGLSRGQLDAMRVSTRRAIADNGGKGDADQIMRAMLASRLFLGSQAAKEASDPANVAANNMLMAANILREIMSKLSSDVSTKKAGH